MRGSGAQFDVVVCQPPMLKSAIRILEVIVPAIGRFFDAVFREGNSVLRERVAVLEEKVKQLEEKAKDD